MKRKPADFIVPLLLFGLAGGLFWFKRSDDMAFSRPLPAYTFHSSPGDFNRFAVETYLKLVQSKGDDNAAFSPYALSTTLEILYAGASDETARSLERMLHLPPKPLETKTSTTKMPTHPALFDYRTPEKPKTTEERKEKFPPILLMGNSLWYSSECPADVGFIGSINGHFPLEIFSVDYRKNLPAINERMGVWSNRTTQGLVRNVSPDLSHETVFCLLGTLYFKALWENKFPTFRTTDGEFRLISGKRVAVPMMNEEMTVPYWENEALQAVELLYTLSDLAMVILLPKSDDGLADLQSRLNAEDLETWLQSMDAQQLGISLPKFRLEQENDIRKILDKKIVRGTFPGLFPTLPVSLENSSAVQNISLEIDEHGTEAAVYTDMAYAKLAAGDSPAFVADHPFLFLIRDRKSGTILFLGRVMDPSRK